MSNLFNNEKVSELFKETCLLFLKEDYDEHKIINNENGLEYKISDEYSVRLLRKENGRLSNTISVKYPDDFLKNNYPAVLAYYDENKDVFYVRGAIKESALDDWYKPSKEVKYYDSAKEAAAIVKGLVDYNLDRNRHIEESIIQEHSFWR